MNKIKEYKITVLFVVICIAFLIGVFIPYFEADYKQALNQFSVVNGEYYSMRNEAENYKN